MSRKETCLGVVSTPVCGSLAEAGSLLEHSAGVYRIAGNWVHGFGGGGVWRCLEQFIFQRYNKGG